MAGRYGPNIITDNLDFYFDAGNKESYPQTGTAWSDLIGNAIDGTLYDSTFASENTKNSVSGGTITNDGEYIIHTFTSTGSTNFVTDVALTADVLIVGGGGSGGYALGGGGGGGGVVHLQGLSVAAGTYSMVVGAGGTGGSSDSDGSNSAAFSSTAYGGGSGGGYSTDAGNNGGSGGGAGSNQSSLLSGGTASKGALGGNPGITYGNDGGDQTTARSGDPTSARGGGGAGAAGADENSNNTDGGDGGAGIQINIDGNNYYWAAGGGGAAYTGYYGGDGGLGGGGGASNNQSHAAGTGLGGTGGINDGAAFSSGHGGAGGANTGSGGGGGSWSSGSGGAGGSGIVIVRYHRSFAPRRFYLNFDDATAGALWANGTNSEPFNTTGAVTVAIWVRLSTTSTHQTLVVEGADSSDNNCCWLLRATGNSGQIEWSLSPYGFSEFTTVSVTGTVDVWQYWVGTFDGTTNSDGQVLYKNGASVATTTPDATTLKIDTTYGFSIGGDRGVRYGLIDGDISQVKIYNRALSAAEVLQNYNAHKGRYGL